MDKKELWHSKGHMDLSCAPVKQEGYETRYIEYSDHEKLLEENKKMSAVLKQHHQWHQDIGTVKLIHDDGRETELDLSAEYSESNLCDETIEALDL